MPGYGDRRTYWWKMGTTRARKLKPVYDYAPAIDREAVTVCETHRKGTTEYGIERRKISEEITSDLFGIDKRGCEVLREAWRIAPATSTSLLVRLRVPGLSWRPDFGSNMMIGLKTD